MKIKEGLKTYIGTRYLLQKRKEKIAQQAIKDITTGGIFCHHYGQVDRISKRAFDSFERNCNYKRVTQNISADDPLVAYKLT